MSTDNSTVRHSLKYKVMSVFILILLVLATTAFATEERHVSLNPIRRWYALDNRIWPDSSTPLRMHEMVFIHDGKESNIGCTEEIRERLANFFKSYSGKPEARVGEVCGRPYVVFRGDDFVSAFGNEGLEFVLAHESFHLLGQIYSTRIQFSALLAPRLPPSRLAIEFMETINTLNAEWQNPKRNFLILEVVNIYRQLSAEDLTELNFLAAFEWPAEYYAYAYMVRRSSNWEEKYKNMRIALGSAVEYSCGVAVGRILDRMIDDRAWKNRVNDGQTMLDIMINSLDGSIGIPSRGLGFVSSWPLNLD